MKYPDLRSPREAIEWCIGKLRDARETWRMATDRNAPPLIRAAARQLAIAGSDPRRYTTDRGGNRRLVGLDPECGRAFERLADRLDGRPVQSVHVHRTTQRSPAESLAALEALMARNPALATMLAPRLAMLAPVASPPVLDAGHEGGGGPPIEDAKGGGAPPSMFRPNPELVGLSPSPVSDVVESAVLESASSPEASPGASEGVGPLPMGPEVPEAVDGDPVETLTPRQRVLARRRAESAERARRRRVESRGTEF